jgi:hypothetical protein
MSIRLNGIKIPGYNQKVSANLRLESVDISGKTSYTPRAETGDKPKSVSVALQIRFIDEAQLKLIVQLAEAKNDKDERVIYNILNRTANTFGMRQIRFDGDVQAREDQSLELWNVTFELIEYNSTAEKKEQRSTSKKVNEQSAGSAAGQSADQTVDLTRFEKLQSKLNEILS